MELHIVKAGSVKKGDTVFLKSPYKKGSPFDTEHPIKVDEVKKFKGGVTEKMQACIYSNGEPVKLLYAETKILKEVK